MTWTTTNDNQPKAAATTQTRQTQHNCRRHPKQPSTTTSNSPDYHIYSFITVERKNVFASFCSCKSVYSTCNTKIQVHYYPIRNAWIWLFQLFKKPPTHSFNKLSNNRKNRLRLPAPSTCLCGGKKNLNNPTVADVPRLDLGKCSPNQLFICMKRPALMWLVTTTCCT